jgi:hypothetical protein
VGRRLGGDRSCQGRHLSGQTPRRVPCQGRWRSAGPARTDLVRRLALRDLDRPRGCVRRPAREQVHSPQGDPERAGRRRREQQPHRGTGWSPGHGDLCILRSLQAEVDVVGDDRLLSH